MKRHPLPRLAASAAIALALGAWTAPARAADGLFLAPSSVLSQVPGAVTIHDYGSSRLVRIHDADGLRTDLASRLHAVPSPDLAWFRSWAADPDDRRSPSSAGAGTFLITLAGPVDQRWVADLESFGLTLVARAYPFGVVAHGDAGAFARTADLSTSAGAPVVRAVLQLPIAARMHRDLLAAIGSEAGGLPTPVHFTTASAEKDGRPVSTRTVSPASLPALLQADPRIIYVEPATRVELHNNLAVRSPLMAVQPVWDDIGFNGTGMVVNHNDTGVDLHHPDLPAEAIAATIGRMAYTNSSHGSHTAGSVAGRGSAPSPLNSWACGDQTQATATVRGAAWGARLAINNILDGGLSEVDEMMAWAVRQGAHLSTNSWGLTGMIGPATAYGRASVAADLAVRDADPQTAGAQELAIFFSSGNLGPRAATVSSPGNAKNVITVGATHNDRCGSWIPEEEDGPNTATVLSISSRGPSQGRIKPDLVAPGSDVLSLQSGDPEAGHPWDQEWTGALYTLNTGTSMACALAAGAGAVFAESQWRSTGLRPSPALVKAALINGATDLGLSRGEQGWGRLNLERSISGPPGGRVTSVDQIDTAELATGELWRHELQVFSDAAPLKLTIVWSDVPGEEDAEHPLRNDLDLVVYAPGGVVYRGNTFTGRWSTSDPGAVGDRDNTVENVFIEAPATGTWQVEVVAVNVAQNPPGLAGQDFAFVYSGDAADCVAPAPPTSLAAVAIADNLIELSWTAVQGAEAYSVYRSTNPGGSPYEPVATVAAPADRWQDTAVHGGITYYYVVRALTACWSEQSAEASATSTGSCSLEPVFAGLSSVRDAEQVGCSLELSWDAATLPCGGTARYDVFRSMVEDFDPGPHDRIAEGVLGGAFVDTGLTHDLTAFYVVRAVDPGSGVSDSNRVHRSGTPTGPDLVWFSDDAESGSDQWHVHRGSTADSRTEHWHVTTSDAHSPTSSWYCSDDDVTKDQVLATATPLTISSQASTTLEFHHRFDFVQRRDGSRLEYSTNGGGRWHDILAGDGFTIAANPKRFTEGPYNFTLSAGGSSNPLAGTDGWSGNSLGWRRTTVDLSDFAGHALRLRWRVGCDAGNSAGGGWWVDDIRIYHGTMCQSCTPPPPPAGLLAAAGSGEVRLQWDETAVATEYQVFRGTRPGGPHALLATVDAAFTDHVDATASGGSRYVYAVTVHTDCTSDLSDEVVVDALGPCTLPPMFWGLQNVSNAGDTSCALLLSWDPATPRCTDSRAGYRIYRVPSPEVAPGPSTLLATISGGTEFRDENLGDGDPSHYVVRAFDLTNLNEDGNRKTLNGAPTGPPHVLFEDHMSGSAGSWRPATGSVADSGTELWAIAYEIDGVQDPHWFCANEPAVKDQVLELVETLRLPAAISPVLEFRHRFDLEGLWDGGRLEYSTDSGGAWHDILAGNASGIQDNPARILAGRYSATLQIGTGSNPLAGQETWTGDSQGWTTVRIDLEDFAGTEVMLRWRLGCDDSRAATGWWVDDVLVYWITECSTRSTQAPRRGGGRVR